MTADSFEQGGTFGLVNLTVIEVGAAALPSGIQAPLAELAVFAEDEQVPEAAVSTLWRHTGNLSPRQSRKLLVDLKQRSLVQLARTAETATEGNGTISLHDLIHDHRVRLAQQRLGRESALHTRPGDPMPKGFVKQFMYPFFGRPRATGIEGPNAGSQSGAN